MVPQQQRRRRRRAALARTSERRVVVLRGPGGFGFTIAGQRPCVVSAVAAGGPAERAGLRAGDALLAVDGASVSRAPHAAVARLVAAAPQAIALSVAPRESPPTDTEDTEPDERARTRRRHPPPRRRLQHPPLMHLPGCHAAPSTSGVKEILHNLSRSQFSPSSQAARLECRAVVGYLGTIETPTAASETPPSSVRTAVRRLRQERRPAAPVLLSVLPNVLMLRRPNGQTLAQYPRERIVYAGCGSDVDRRYFGLVTAAESSDNDEVSHSCHVFAVDPRLAEHEAHEGRSREFQIVCTRDPVVERCLEFPPSSEYVVGIIKGMYSLPADDCTSPSLLQISKLAIKGDSPALANFSRNNRALRVPRLARRPNRYEEYQPGPDGHEFVANSPQPSNHSEITTTSSNSDSGIGFHNDGRNIADRILVVDFGIQQPPPLRYPALRRPLGLVGVEDGAFLSNTTPVVDGFGGQGRPLDHREDVMLNPSDMQPIQPMYSPRKNEDSADMYNYNNVYGNIPSCSRTFPNGVVYDQVYTENEGHYELIPVHNDSDQVSQPTEGFNSVEIYEENRFNPESFEAESVENVTVVSGTASKASMDSVSIYSCRSHEEARPSRMRHLQASLDDMLVLGLRDDHNAKDDGHFVHPANVKFKSRKSKPLNILSRTKQILTGRDRSEKRRESLGRARALSASAGDVCEDAASVPAAASEPDLRDSGQSVETSPFRRWTTGSGAGSSLRHHDHRNMYNKQMSEGTALAERCSSGNVGNVARWSLGLEQLLADPAGAAAFDHFLRNEFAHENIRFWWACEQYRTCADESKREQMAQEIWQRHLAEGAHESVNIDAAARRAADARRSQWPADPDIFLQAQKHIFNLMKLDSYPRFLRSSVHAECARANLCGLPPPYETRGTPEREPTPTKLKKSASNASDRRRSGSSLLWKLRAVSKDRAQNASTNSVVSNSDTASAHDVVTSSTTPAGCSLCRVVLPDRSTSVVEVNSAVPVKRLIDKMLDKRKIQCHSYDVLLKNGSQSTTTLVDSASPSTILGGREALVEQRCVVRLELCGRCVAVRCRPQRKLKHALKPVLARYCSALQDASVSAWRDNERVHEDTSMLDLDGERLQIILTSNEDRHSDFHTLEREEDTEFPGDLAVRLNDDVDTLSATSSAGRSEASGAGRVRATLRAGPPLHHHPPDFLENLRETQRLRLQNRSESGGGSGSGPEPRSPPPLPPKPR